GEAGGGASGAGGTPLPSAAQGPLPAGFQRVGPAGRDAPAPGDSARDGRPGPGGPADGDGPGGERAARHRAIAAYHAGTQAAARLRAETPERREDWWATPRGTGNRPADDTGPAPGAPDVPEPGAAYGPRGRPYGRPVDRAPGPGLPAREAPSGAGPTALPGTRQGASRPVPTPWAPGAPARVPAQAGAPDDGRHDVPHDVPHDGSQGGHHHGNALPHQAAEVPGSEEPERYRGPATLRSAERARQARTTVVGAVTERWAPEQAGPVHANWRLAPPVGPAADLWALGVLLFRAVQGHAPYPEESAAELVQLVCAEPPAFAEDCGPLRPVVESLLRQDPAERPDFEVLRGWLRSLIRSAPEPDVGRRAVHAPPSLEPGGPADPRRLPIRRRRGELVRRRRGRRRGAAQAAARSAPRAGGLHELGLDGTGPSAEAPAPRRTRKPRAPRAERAPRAPRPPRATRSSSPRSLGRLLLGGVLLALVLCVLYAVMFLPKQDTAGAGGENRQRGSLGDPAATPGPSERPGEDGADGRKGADDGAGAGGREARTPSAAGQRTRPQTSAPAAAADGFRMHQDPSGFRIAVPEGWDRRVAGARGQVRFDQGDFEMVVVKGRDTAAEFGTDPMAYQSESEPELEPFRSSAWSSASSLRRIDVGDTAMAEGTYTWKDASGRDVYVRNRAMLLGARYHLVLVIGPEDERDAVDRWFEGAVDTYRVLDR
ncbi:hypothetical protein HOY81_26360, partial [Streptomyces sp. JJ36]|nr:hypothetical protein [Streptomyces sp. JJ36]